MVIHTYILFKWHFRPVFGPILGPFLAKNILLNCHPEFLVLRVDEVEGGGDGEDLDELGQHGLPVVGPAVLQDLGSTEGGFTYK